MINEEVVPQMIERFDHNHFGDSLFPNSWWFQDGAGCHRQRNVILRLHELFGNRVVALGQPIEWPARSPALTLCEFFLWGL